MGAYVCVRVCVSYILSRIWPRLSESEPEEFFFESDSRSIIRLFAPAYDNGA